MSRGRGRRRSEPKRVGSLVGQVLGELGLDAAAGAFRIGERWEEAVGSEIARHSRPVAMRGSTLEVDVDSPVWGQQLQLRRPELLNALAGVLGEDAPSDLRFRVGYIRRP